LKKGRFLLLAVLKDQELPASLAAWVAYQSLGCWGV